MWAARNCCSTGGKSMSELMLMQKVLLLIGGCQIIIAWIKQIIRSKQATPPIKYVRIGGECMTHPNNRFRWVAKGMIRKGGLGEGIATFEDEGGG